ncbi:MAG TPA: hypothetical protein PKJ79_10260, partial [Quisquiliibacterium sp.]|nr:hypothetical protein [Quisquiliibacterium sp.]
MADTVRASMTGRAGGALVALLALVVAGPAGASGPALRLPEFRPEAITTVDDAERALRAAEAVRGGLPAEWAARRRDCAGRVMVSACEAEVAQDRRATEQEL